MSFYIHLLELILFFKLHLLCRVWMIPLVYYKYDYSLANVGTLIQTFHFYTLTAKQVNVQN